ncbi:MAG: sigma-70 family RNA polymerase sigma factor [Acidimicrobiales bacterium]|nr:sigma-70 family RNA polymerase sigma factor [Acidimicrobiales bacterium]
MTDEALLDGLGAGSPDAALAFVRRFQAHVYGVALALVGDAAAADDVAQQTFERVWRRSSTFDAHRGNVRAWLTTITRNLAVDTLRVRRPEPVDPTDLIRLLGPGRDEPETGSLRNESRDMLRKALRRLPAEQARALVMAGVYRMTAQEVAEAEKIPLGTAKTRIRAAMIKVRQELSALEASHE